MKIQIGSIEKTYKIVETKAPESYDGFGTFTLHEVNGKRWVLIEEEHYNWQSLRYGSGLHGATLMSERELKEMRRTIEDILYKRLIGGKE